VPLGKSAVVDEAVWYGIDPDAPPTKLVAVEEFPPMFKLATGVVDVTTNGGKPVAKVEVNCPVTFKLVPVATPRTGVTRVGEVANTRAPEPVSPEIT
jgi:hypothetical protein